MQGMISHTMYSQWCLKEMVNQPKLVYLKSYCPVPIMFSFKTVFCHFTSQSFPWTPTKFTKPRLKIIKSGSTRKTMAQNKSQVAAS